MTLIRALFFLAVSVFALQAANPLDFYLIDVEGGKCVLVVSPSGQSLLYDAGWPGQGGRDNNRIVEAAKAAGLKQIDYLVISHYDVDHLGDVPALLAAFPVKHIIDNGSLQTPGADFERRYKPFAEARDAMPHIGCPGGRESSDQGGGRHGSLCGHKGPIEPAPWRRGAQPGLRRHARQARDQE